VHLVASTAYLARRGVPRHARELAAHDAIVASPLLR
jgi:LysR family transcriptional regulator, transcriptional activator AphB